MSKYRRVIVESPLSGDEERNNRYLDDCLKDCYRRGESPFASHAIGPRCLNDLDPEERKTGMEAGFAWIEAADATVVYEDLGVSKGMMEGIKRAEAAGKPVERRKLGDKWANPSLLRSHAILVGVESRIEEILPHANTSTQEQIMDVVHGLYRSQREMLDVLATLDGCKKNKS